MMWSTFQPRPWSKILARPSSADKILVPFFLAGVPFCAGYELMCVFPFYFPPGTPWSLSQIFHIVVGLFLAFQVYGNMLQTMRSDSSVHAQFPADSGSSTIHPLSVASSKRTLASILPSEQIRYCSICIGTVPNRSHHCSLCNTCILRHDHHCWFSGTCIGSTNYRYYLGTVTYSLLAAVYCNLFNISFVVTRLQSANPFYIFLCMFAPHVPASLGYLSLEQFAVATLTSVGAILMLVIGYLVAIQVFQLSKGQTAWERRFDYTDFHQGDLKSNVLQVVGSGSWAIFVCPWMETSVNLEGELLPRLHKQT